MINEGSSGCTDIAAADRLYLSGGGPHVVVLKGDKVFACGDNSEYQLGNNTTVQSNELISIPGAGTSGVSLIAAGAGTSYVVKSGAIFGCGRNDYGQLSTGGASINKRVLTAGTLNAASGVTVIAASYRSMVALKGDAAYYCGWNAYGESGSSYTTVRDFLKPMEGVGTSGCTDIKCGRNTTFVLKGDAVFACGYGTYGSLGNGGTLHKQFLTAMTGAGSSGCSAISVSRFTTLVLKGNSAYACGGNDNGQICDGTITQRNSLVAMINNGSNYVQQVSAGDHFSSCLRGYKPYAGGINISGQLANGTTIEKHEMTLCTSV